MQDLTQCADMRFLLDEARVSAVMLSPLLLGGCCNPHPGILADEQVTFVLPAKSKHRRNKGKRNTAASTQLRSPCPIITCTNT